MSPLSVTNSQVNETPTPGIFAKALAMLPNIYIPMLFSNITEQKLRDIISQLDAFTPKTINIDTKVLKNGTQCQYVFIDVAYWHSNETAQKMRAKLNKNEEVKVVFNNPWFFICKRKHEEDLQDKVKTSSSSTIPNKEINLAPAPRNVKGVSRGSNSSTPESISFNSLSDHTTPPHSPDSPDSSTSLLSNTSSLSPRHYDPDYCYECEVGMGNQLAHTCILRSMEAAENSSSGDE